MNTLKALHITMFAPHLTPANEVEEVDDFTPATEEAIDTEWMAYDDHYYNTAGLCWRDETPEWLQRADY